MTKTLLKNQNGPEMYSITIGTAKAKPISTISAPNIPMPILLAGLLWRRARYKVPPPIPTVITAGAQSRKFSQVTPEKGRSHPPKNNVVALAQTTKILEQSDTNEP